MNIVDDLIVVHHQATATSLLFDISTSGEGDPVTGIISHSPIVPGKSIKSISLKIPSISLEEKIMNYELCKFY